MIHQHTDEIMMDGIQPLPGVMEQLHTLAAHPLFDDHVMCGLVTGNVEGIARKKMRSCGIWDTKVLSRKALDQQCWEGEEVAAFLGGSYFAHYTLTLSSLPPPHTLALVSLIYRLQSLLH